MEGLFHGSLPYVMGTRLECIIAGAPQSKSEPLWNKLSEIAVRLDSGLNRFDPKSEVGTLNAACPISGTEISRGLASLLEESRRWWELTDGLFDVCRGGMKDLSLTYSPQGKATVSIPASGLDFGGIAKGWFLKICRQVLLEEGIGCAFVNFGGSAILALGGQPGAESWKVRVTSPYDGIPVCEVTLRDKALSTSGNSPGYTGHVVNPKTGKAVEDKILTAAVCDDPLEAEVLSTTLMMADGGQRKKLRGRFPECEFGIYEL